MAITFKNISKKFQQKDVISNFNLHITPGTFVCLVGPSGCGKTTLLRLMADLEHPTNGQLDLPAEVRQNKSYVFQEANLLPWLSVAENVLLPLNLSHSMKQISREKKSQMVLEALDKVQLQGAEKLFPHELSGGMKMRTSLARALVTTPRLLLMDEPFAALDENTRFEMQNQLRRLWLQEKMTVVFVTHSLFEAVYLSERVLVLSKSGAQIIKDQIINLPPSREESLRTSEELNSIVRLLNTGGH
jgi:NitT/TauT family transport system ATP-binding protein